MIGLFGCVADPNARIANLELLAPHVYVKNGSDVGSLVGRLEGGSIINCQTNQGLVLVEAASNVGSLAGTVESGTLTDCGSNRSVVVQDEEGSYVGGLIGRLREGTLTGCYADEGLASGENSVGGLLGINLGGTIKDCWATAAVMGNVEIGGLVGSNAGTITGAHATGDVWGDTHVGGLVGWNTVSRRRGGADGGRLGEIDTCYSEGTVIGQDYVGGLVGGNGGIIGECFANGDVIGDRDVGGLVGSHAWQTISVCYATGSVTGGETVGGLAGYNGGAITACYANGSVSGDETAGGLVGENRDTITACYATGSVVGDDPVGGLVGDNMGNITHCYSTSSAGGTADAGGLVGHSDDKNDTFACFWDIKTSRLAASAGGIGKTTAQMQMAETFSGWGACEGQDVWTIDEGNDYPRLWWESSPGQPITFTYPVGAGTADDPYLIRSAEELNCIGLMPCEWDKHFKQMADIDLSLYAGQAINRIGRQDSPFRGIFDGNGYIISNLTYACEDVEYVGLFSYVSDPNAEIKNVTLIGLNLDAIRGKDTGALIGCLADGLLADCEAIGGCVSGGTTVGALVGDNRGGTIVRCQTSTTVQGWGCLGGIAGRNHGKIADSRAYGDILGGDSAGGMVGWNADEGQIVNCTATGAVTTSRWRAGGLAGSNDGTLRNCYATAAVVGEDYVGGLAGANKGVIEDCYTTGSVTGLESVGGLLGHNCGTVTSCFAAGTVTGDAYVGGLVGWGSQTGITGSFWDIETTGYTTSTGGTGLTSDLMQSASTFLDATWDLVGESDNGTEDIWMICEGMDYPHLSWEGLTCVE